MTRPPLPPRCMLPIDDTPRALAARAAAAVGVLQGLRACGLRDADRLAVLLSALAEEVMASAAGEESAAVDYLAHALGRLVGEEVGRRAGLGAMAPRGGGHDGGHFFPRHAARRRCCRLSARLVGWRGVGRMAGHAPRPLPAARRVVEPRRDGRFHQSRRSSPRPPGRRPVIGFMTPAEANMAAAHALLVEAPDGMFGDYARWLLERALPQEPRLQQVLATLAVCIERRNVTEAAAQLAPLLPQAPAAG